MVLRRKQLASQKGLIGVISDTHGLVRPEALAALRGVDLIVHAGDIGKPEVLAAFGAIAPVNAIRGNNDRGPWADKLPDLLDLRIDGTKIHVIHDANELERDLDGAGVGIVISGHSHKPGIVTRNNVIFLNPGSAGPRRFKLPVTVARLERSNNEFSARLITLMEFH